MTTYKKQKNIPNIQIMCIIINIRRIKQIFVATISNFFKVKGIKFILVYKPDFFNHKNLILYELVYHDY